MFIYKNNFNHINVVSLLAVIFHAYFLLIPIMNYYGIWYLIPLLVHLGLYFNYIYKYTRNMFKSYSTRRNLVKLVKKYHEKVRLERKIETRKNIIKNISNQITNQVIEESIKNLNLLEHKESMQKILENVNQLKLFNDFFKDFKLIIIDYHKVERNFLKKLSKFCRINNKELLLISQDNPVKILNELKIKYFNLNNIYTPYHFKSSFFGSYYRININSLRESINKKLDLDNLYLFNQIIKEKKTDECVYFGDDIANKIDKKNIMAFNIDLNQESFINIIEDWIEIK